MSNYLQRVAYGAAVLLIPALAAVVGGELGPGSGAPNISDKLLHFIAYFGLAFLASLALMPRRKVLLGMLGLIAMGALLEVIQGFVGRDSSIYDELANTAGVIAGAAVAWLALALLVRLQPAD